MKISMTTLSKITLGRMTFTKLNDHVYLLLRKVRDILKNVVQMNVVLPNVLAPLKYARL